VSSGVDVPWEPMWIKAIIRPNNVPSTFLGSAHLDLKSMSYLPVDDTLPQVGLYKIFFYFESFVHESNLRSFLLPTCIAHTVAIRLHDYCAVYDPPPRPPFCMPYTIQYW